MSTTTVGVSPGHRSAAGQLADLAALRWSMLGRSHRVWFALGMLVVTASGPGALALGAWAGHRMPRDRFLMVVELLGGAFTVVAIGIIVAAVTSSGGREILPRQQLVAYPVSATAEHLAALAMAPSNIAWLLQVAGVMLLTGVATRFSFDFAVTRAVESSTQQAPGMGMLVLGCVLAYLVALMWVAAATALAQLLAWSVEVIRTLPGGRWAIRAIVVLGVLFGARSANATTLTAVLDWKVTTVLTDAAVAGGGGAYRSGLGWAAVLAVVALTLVVAGAGVYRVLLRRPTREQVRSETYVHLTRALPEPGSFAADLRAFRRQDWAVVWRSVPLRRGLIVLLVVPAVGGLLAHIGWRDLALMTGVVAAGAGLLFGVNAFSLDADGATWRAGLPVSPRVWLGARLLVLAEVVGASALVSTVAAALGAVGRPTAGALVAAATAVVVVTVQVVAVSARWSVHHPERAELRTTRDSPTSPGRMMICSTRLVFGGVLVSTVIALAGRWHPVVPVLVALPLLAWSGLVIVRAFRAFDDPLIRARVVQAVSRG